MHYVPIMIIFKLQGEWLYIIGRLAALSSRPLLLLVLKHLVNEELASVVAVIFLISMLAVAISGFDTHRNFYKLYFGTRISPGIKDTYKTYCNSIALQIGLVTPLLIGFVVYRFDDIWLSLLIILFFASERLADEAQRFLIFDGKRKEWGARNFIKTLIQLIGISIIINEISTNKIHLIVFILLIGNVLVYGVKFPVRYLLNLGTQWSKIIILLQEQKIFWLLSTMSIVISYWDRILVLIYSQSDLAAYTILVSSMSIIQNIMDYFYISLKRKEILQGKIGLREVFYSRHFCFTMAFAIFFGCCASLIMFNIYYDGQIRNLDLIPIVLVSQITLAVALVIREIIYWNRNIDGLIFIEGSFIIILLIVGAILLHYNFNYKFSLGIFSFVLILRLILLIRNVVVVTTKKKLK